MKYTLRQLEIFVAIGRSESVSRAAAELALSQSAASTALGEFERQFDTQLFDRVGKKLQLNELGRVLLPKASELLDRAQEIQSLLEGKEALGSLRVGATLTIGNYLAPLIVGEFQQRHPGSRVKLEVHNTAAVIQQVAHFEMDLGLIEGACQHPDLQVTRWMDDELVIFCAPQHPLAQQKRVTLDDLLTQPWILREPGSGTRETFDQAMRQVLPQLNVQLELEHTEAIKRAVEAGLGVSCISRLALRDAFRRGSLVPLDVAGLDFSRSFHFVWHRQKYQTAGIRHFLEQCRALSAGVQRSDELALPAVP
jgi:DNA-binding transcriptional LysR family regulator